MGLLPFAFKENDQFTVGNIKAVPGEGKSGYFHVEEKGGIGRRRLFV